MMTARFSLVLATSVMSSGIAVAEPRLADIDRGVAPVTRALEVAFGAAKMRSTGDVGGGMGQMQDFTSAGGGAELQLGVRVSSHLTLGAYGTLAGYNVAGNFRPAADTSVGATAGIKADWHFRPARAIDPWISVGGGWRGLWLGTRDATALKLHGVDVARLQVGIDYRITPDFSISPMLGASATMFIASGTMQSGWSELDDRKIGIAVTGGLLARFDLFGSRGR